MRTKENSAGSRALIAAAPVAERAPVPFCAQRPNAAFLAHLIATARQVPQTRERRRSEPDVAVAAYAACAAPFAPDAPSIARSS